MNSRRLLLVITVCLIFLLPICLNAQTSAPNEYQVKAAFLYNFIKFVEWPPESFQDERQPILLCLFGENPFGETLAMVASRPVKERSLLVKTITSVDAASGCQVIFISPAEEQQRILVMVKTKPVLTVGETEHFAAKGGIINFIVIDNKINFEINPEAAQRARLSISSQLLKLARIVKEAQ